MRTHLFRLAARGTWRHRTRSLLTAAMVALGVALLVMGLTWVTGIFGGMMEESASIAGHVRIVTQEYSAQEQLAPLYENIEPSDPLVELLSKHPDVVAAMPRIMTGVTVTVGEEIGDVFAGAVGAPESYYRDRLQAMDELIEGRWFENEDELVMGHRVVRQVDAQLGDEVVLLGMTQDGSMSPAMGTLVGILHAGSSFFDQQVFLPLEELRWITDIPEGTIEILVFGERYQDAPALARSLRELPELEGMAVEAWIEREPYGGLAGFMEQVQGILVFAIVLLAALGILNTMMMSVLERTSEIGVLRAMGLGRLGVVWIFIVEAIIIAGLGGLAGIVLGIGPAWLLHARGVEIGDVATTLAADLPVTATVYGELTAGVVLGSFLLGLLAAFIGSVIPSIRAAYVQPVVAMRTRR